MVYFWRNIPIGFIFKVYINRVYLRKNIETVDVLILVYLNVNVI